MINKVGIIGAGFMGNQLAFYLLKNNISVVLIDLFAEHLTVAKDQIAAMAAQFEIELDASLLECSTDMVSSIEDCQLVIDCTPEDRKLKLKLFSDLEWYCHHNGCILATNSSAISASELDRSFHIEGSATRVLNMHFLPPIWDRPLVEIMRGQFTSNETVSTIVAFVKSVGLVPIVLKNENRGFVFNFIWQSIKATCLDLVDRDIADIADIDLAWRTGMGMKVGPFQVMDMVGLDVVAAVFREHSQPVPQVLVGLISDGKLGQKSGAGFYNYT